MGRGGIGFPGGGRRGGGGMGGQTRGLSSEEMERLSAQSKELRIEQQQKKFVISDDSGEPRALYPDGKKRPTTARASSPAGRRWCR